MKCRRCGTYFDYERHYGICPKCAAYNREDGKDEMELFHVDGRSRYHSDEKYQEPKMQGMMEVHEDLHKKYDSSYSHEKVTFSKKTDASSMDRQNRGMGKPARIILVLAVLVIIWTAVMFLFAEYYPELLSQRAEITEEAEAGERQENQMTINL